MEEKIPNVHSPTMKLIWDSHMKAITQLQLNNRGKWEGGGWVEGGESVGSHLWCILQGYLRNLVNVECKCFGTVTEITPERLC